MLYGTMPVLLPRSRGLRVMRVARAAVATFVGVSLLAMIAARPTPTSAYLSSNYEHSVVINASGFYVTITGSNVTESYQLSCADFDDDRLYPQKPGADPDDASADCEAQDSSTQRCNRCLKDDLCSTMCGDATALCDDGAGQYEYIQPCMWELIANLPAACHDAFVNYPPFSSNNAPPAQSLEDLTTHNSAVWGCETHAMCGACADLTQPTTLAPVCLSVVSYYLSLGVTPGNIERRFFRDFNDFWCSPSVLAQVQQGSAPNLVA